MLDLVLDIFMSSRIMLITLLRQEKAHYHLFAWFFSLLFFSKLLILDTSTQASLSIGLLLGLSMLSLIVLMCFHKWWIITSWGFSISEMLLIQPMVFNFGSNYNHHYIIQLNDGLIPLLIIGLLVWLTFVIVVVECPPIVIKFSINLPFLCWNTPLPLIWIVLVQLTGWVVVIFFVWTKEIYVYIHTLVMIWVVVSYYVN